MSSSDADGPMPPPSVGPARLSRQNTTTLWAHLIRKPASATFPPSGPSASASTSAPPIPTPPLAPVDKTGASLRILLLDTKSDMEKFSTRVDTLLQRVGEVADGMQGVKKSLEEQDDRMSEEIHLAGAYVPLLHWYLKTALFGPRYLKICAYMLKQRFSETIARCFTG
jgi:hypothetical protein